MTDRNEPIADAPVLRNATRKHRAFAFFATGATVFLLICLTWPLTMRGYRCEAIIDIDDVENGKVSVQDELPAVLRTVMEPSSMVNRLKQVYKTAPIRSRVLGAGNLDAINRRIQIGFRDATNAKPAQLRVAFVGSGQADEAKFIELLTADIAQHLASSVTQSDIATSGDSSKVHSFEQANWLVDQIEEGVSNARAQTAALVDHTRSSGQVSAFRNVGHIREIDPPTVDSLHQTLESVDVSSLRGVINQMTTVDDTLGAGPVRFNAQSVINQPVDASPDAASLLLACLVAMVIGGVVSLHVQPFVKPGFKDLDEVANQLGVPIVATVSSDSSNVAAEEEGVKLGWANQVLNLSTTLLLAISVLAGGFWLTSAAVRDAFGESMFHGFARIFWSLSGA